MANPPVPNFFLVGAPKAGTTAFVRYLEQHPSVYVSPIKEPCFFAPEAADYDPAARDRFRRDREAIRAYLNQPSLERRDFGLVLEWDEYLKLFKGARQETAIGEASVSYLGSPGAAAAIRARVPEARILMLLRDPADRLMSHWAAAWAAGATTAGFADWIDTQVEEERHREPPAGNVWAGFYGRHLERYLENFPETQIKPIIYDDYVRDVHTSLRDVFAFLGVDAHWTIDVTRRHNVTRVPRWPRLDRLTSPVRGVVRSVVPDTLARHMRDWSRRPFHPVASVDERARAIAVYADDIRTLAQLLQRDLSPWLDPRRSR